MREVVVTIKLIIINNFQATDVSDNEIGGHAVIEHGGIGYNFVQISLTSNFFKRLEYHVEVYTAPPTTATTTTAAPITPTTSSLDA